MADINLTSTTSSGFLETDFDQLKTLIDGIADNSISLNNAKISYPGNASATELNYLVGVTSLIQTQIDSKPNKILTDQTVGGSNGNAVYLSGADTWTAADASAESTCSKLLGIRISATEVQTHGVYTTTGLTAGSIYYVSETTGAITATQPTTATSIVRVIGYALSTTELFIDPDKTWVEIGA